ncbi:IS66 family insertion sequence element accessory protein TnpA [Alicyclobacillus hesperidum]|uniref:IS66 family insertion sequence element accessory protein TnpA n=1 Tax=Alicyclobacillus hesperidum TaxID=89784 RepID=UPI003B42BF63
MSVSSIGRLLYMPEHMSRQQRRELWRERIGSFYDSGLSAVQFCAEHGLKPHQLWC